MGRLVLLIVLGPTLVFAGPPFRTYDPDPVPWHHYEAYVFSSEPFLPVHLSLYSRNLYVLLTPR